VALWDCVHYAGTSSLSSNSVMRLNLLAHVLVQFISTKYKPTFFLSSLKTIDKISRTMMMWVSYTSIFTDFFFEIKGPHPPVSLTKQASYKTYIGLKV
jgi:hypothetical protein